MATEGTGISLAFEEPQRGVGSAYGDSVGLESGPGGSDRIRWLREPSGIFSVRSAYRFLNDGGRAPPFSAFLWKIRVPPKVLTFLWIVLNNSVLTRDNLKRRRWVGPEECPLCGLVDESVEHLFLHCLLVRPVWIFMLGKLEVLGFPGSVASLWSSWRAARVGRAIRASWDIVVAAIFWGVWSIRNDCIFQARRPSLDYLFSKVLSFISLWAGIAPPRVRRKLAGLFSAQTAVRTLDGTSSGLEEEDGDGHDMEAAP